MKFIQTRKHHTKWGRESRLLAFWSTEFLQGIILSLRVKLQQCRSDNGPYLDSLTPFLYTPTPIKDPLSHDHYDSYQSWPTDLVSFRSMQVYLRVFLAFTIYSETTYLGQLTVRVFDFCSKQAMLGFHWKSAGFLMPTGLPLAKNSV